MSKSYTIYHNPRCRKSREALEILQHQCKEVKVIDYLKNPPSIEELRAIIKMLGIKPEELVRKGEAVYKEKFKDKSLSDEEWINVMVTNPILIERPIIVEGKRAVIGRPPENVQQLL